MNNIRNLFRISLLSFLVGCCSGGVLQGSSQPSAPESHGLKIERLKQSTVAIATNSSGIFVLGCSGVWIDSDVVLTAAHCVDDPEAPFVIVVTHDDFKEKKVRPAVVLASDKTVDLALLVVDTKDLRQHPVVELAFDTALPGDDVHVLGHPVGYLWTYSHGYVAAIREDMEGPNGTSFKKILQVSAPVWMGNSGGGAFDKTGRLIGISSWISKNGPNLSFFVHKDVIEQFMITEMVRREK
jgi:serine protease Do